MRINGGTCIGILNIKFLCLNLWLGEVCTGNANDDNTNDDEAQSMIV